jgi:hypothetical protein
MALGIMEIQWRFKICISWEYTLGTWDLSWDLREMLISSYIYPNI